MTIIGQLTLLSIISFVGTSISATLPITIPPSIIGMLVLLILFMTHIVKLRHIDTVAHFFLVHMGLLFISPVINIIEHFHVLGAYTLQFILICIITTLLTLLASVGAAKLVMRLQHTQRTHGGDM
jgi:putative effector of murein hydrolase LrgA (UPF0299 family)